MATYADFLPGLYPTWLRDAWGRAWGAAEGAAYDACLAAAKSAVKLGFVLLAPSNALPYLVVDVGIDRVPGEISESLRGRIVGAWESWSWVGTSYGITRSVALLGYGTPVVIPYAAMPFDAHPERWARLLVIFTGRASYGTSTYGSATYGARSVQPIESADLATRAALRLVLRKWINARDRVWQVIIARGNALYGRSRYGSAVYCTTPSTRWGPLAYGSATYGTTTYGAFC